MSTVPNFAEKMRETIAMDVVPALSFLMMRWLDGGKYDEYSYTFTRAGLSAGHNTHQPEGKTVKVTFELVDEESA